MAAFGTPYWWEDGAPLPALPEIPPTDCDLLIIGGGYTGLSAAITARREGARVVVIDAMVPGQGASTRNGGMCGAHTRIAIDAMITSFGRDAALAVLNEAPKAYAFTRALIKEEKIECDFKVTGRIVSSSTAASQAYMAGLAEDMNQLAGLDLKVITRAEMGNHVATDFYHGGVLYPDHGGLQPRKFHDGLMRVALEAGVDVVQNCRALAIEGQRGQFAIKTATGNVQAQNVIHATNGYTKRVLPHLARRVFPLPSFLIATAPLETSLIAQLAPGRHMMVETRAKHSYFRISPDGSRIIFGGRAGMIPLSPKRAARRLKATMVDIWPVLRNVDITHSWMGNTGFTFEQMPHVGAHSGQHFAFGYSGSGVVLAPYLGMKAAYQALEDPRGETAYSQTIPTTRFYHHGQSPWFLAAGEIWYRHVVDRIEARQSRADKLQ